MQSKNTSQFWQPSRLLSSVKRLLPSKMGRLALTLGITVLLVAVGLGGLRASIQRIPRVGLVMSETHPTFMGLGSPKDRGTFSDSVLRVVERPDHANRIYDTIMEIIVRSNATGFYPGRAGSPPIHYHTSEDEEFYVVSGVMGYSVDGRIGTSTRGLFVPLGQEHIFWNAHPTKDLRMKAKFIYKSGKPRRVDTYFENLIGFAQKYGSPGQIPPLQQLLSAEEGGMEYTFLPRPVRLVISYVAIPLAKLVGYQPFYAEYTSPA